MNYCRQCGAPLESFQRFCQNCGTLVGSKTYTIQVSGDTLTISDDEGPLTYRRK